MNNFENLIKERLDSNYLKSNRNEIIENKNYQEISKIKQRIEYIEKNQNSLNQILEIYKELRIKEETIKELRAVLPVNIIKGEKIKTIIFSSMVQKINYAIITKNTEIFANLVNKLLNEYPSSKNKSIYFMSNGYVMNYHKTIEENKLHNSDVILMNIENNSATFKKQ